LYTHRLNSNNSDIIGKEAENLFKKIAIERSYKVIKSIYYEDKYDHWDFLMYKYNIISRIEIKGKKREYRYGEQQDKYILIELKGVSGYPGWLYGKADFIGFLCNEGFIIVNRYELEQLLPKLVNLNQEIQESSTDNGLYTLITRSKSNNSDIFTWINKSDLFKLNYRIWTI